MTVFINDETLEQVKDTSDIVEVISDYVSLKKSGVNFMGLCPFHSEKTPSFSVSESKQFYKCFGCGEGGDVIQFVMKKENVDFIEAVKILADRYNIQLEARKVDSEKVEKRDKYYKMNRDAARFFYTNLQKNKFVLKYLRNRKIEANIVNRFGLGYSLDSWDSLLDHLVEKGYEKEEIEDNGLIVERNDGKGYYDRFRNRLIFPIIDHRGRVIGFGGRVLDDSMPKYLNSRDSLVFDKSNSLYGINLVHKQSNREKIILVEGYMDVIALAIAGIDFSVASLGTSLTSQQAKMLKRYGKEIYICYDSDTAGKKASLRAIEILLEAGAEPRIIDLPEGYDPDDYINEFGRLEFDKKINSSKSYVDYRIDILKEDYDLEDIEDTIEFTRKVAKIISEIESPVGQDVYIKKIAEETKVSEDAINKEIESLKKTSKPKRQTGSRTKRPSRQVTSNKEPEEIRPAGANKMAKGYVKAIESLIYMAVKDKYYFEIIADKSIEEDLTGAYKDIYILIEDIYKDQERIDTNELIELYEARNGNVDLLLSLISMNYNYDPVEIEDIIGELINSLKYYRLNYVRDHILGQISSLENKTNKTSDEEDRFNKLCMDLIDLNNQINQIKD